MKRSITFAVLFSTALAVGAGAQSTGGQTPSQSGSSDQSQVTVMGCLQSGDAAAGAGGTGDIGGRLRGRTREQRVPRRWVCPDEREDGQWLDVRQQRHVEQRDGWQRNRIIVSLGYGRRNDAI